MEETARNAIRPVLLAVEQPQRVVSAAILNPHGLTTHLITRAARIVI